MGNALFQFAFGHAVSRRLHSQWFLTDTGRLKYFSLGRYYRTGAILRRRLHGIAASAGLFSLPTVTVGELEEPARVLANVRDAVIYHGYFQSELYFHEYRQEVRELLKVRPAYALGFAERYGALFAAAKTVVVHVRRTDYLNCQVGDFTDVTLPESYYRSALRSIADVNGCLIIFISDDIDWVRNTFSDVRGARFEHDSEIDDFQMLLHADNLILSNSTFSWWGAYLNLKPHKTVVAPQNWFGFRCGHEYPRSILPESWVQIPACGAITSPA